MHVISPLPLPFPTNYTQLAAPTLYTIKTHTHTLIHTYTHADSQGLCIKIELKKTKEKNNTDAKSRDILYRFDIRVTISV